MWAHSSTVPLNSSADEELVEEMALGGRKKGFNPSLNPNRYVYFQPSHN